MKEESRKSQVRSVRVTRSRSGRKVRIKSSKRGRSTGTGSLGMSLKPLFIDDPDTAKDIDPEKLSDQELVEKFKKTELSTKEKIVELFSSHPSIAKRLRALE